jgi:hypothetical protein
MLSLSFSICFNENVCFPLVFQWTCVFPCGFLQFSNEHICFPWFSLGFSWYQQIPSKQDYVGLPLVPTNSIYAGLPGATWGYLWYQQIPSTQDYLGLPLVPINSTYAKLPVATWGYLWYQQISSRQDYLGLPGATSGTSKFHLRKRQA